MRLTSRSRGQASRFRHDRRGGLPMQMALIFGAVGVAAALLLAPALEETTRQYAADDGFGIDRTVTGSVRRAERYTIRRSVLSDRPEIICGRGAAPACGRDAR